MTDPGSLHHCPTSSDTGVYLLSFLYRSAELDDEPLRALTTAVLEIIMLAPTGGRGRGGRGERGEGEEGGEKGGREGGGREGGRMREERSDCEARTHTHTHTHTH